VKLLIAHGDFAITLSVEDHSFSGGFEQCMNGAFASAFIDPKAALQKTNVDGLNDSRGTRRRSPDRQTLRRDQGWRSP
jgi:hypothetical protein